MINEANQARVQAPSRDETTEVAEGTTGVFTRRNLAIAGVLVLSTMAFYLGLAWLWHLPLQGSVSSYFAFQAAAWLHGHWYIAFPSDTVYPLSIRTTVDLIQLHGHYYSIYGPFPAALMLPFVVLFGPSVSDVLSVMVASALNMGLLFLLFEQLRACGLTRRSWRENVLWTVFLYIGSTALSLSLGGGVWYTGHIVACGCLLVALLLAFRRHFVWSAVALSCGFLSRSTLLFGFPMLFYLAWQDGAAGNLFQRFVVSLWVRRPAWNTVPWRRLGGVAAVLAGCLLVYCLRNWSMFGNPLESGYEIQRIQRYPFVAHGVFNLRYIPANLINDFFNFPQVVFPTHYSDSPWIDLENHQNGICVFLTTPLFLFLFARNRQRSWLRVALWATLLLSLAFVLLFYTAGYPQWGTRYLFDIYPYAWVLLIISNVEFDWRVVALGIFALVLNTAASYQHWVHFEFFHLPPLPHFF